jgi:hypothetical protein
MQIPIPGNLADRKNNILSNQIDANGMHKGGLGVVNLIPILLGKPFPFWVLQVPDLLIDDFHSGGPKPLHSLCHDLSAALP